MCGGDAGSRGTRVPIWALEGWHSLGLDKGQIVAHYPGLNPDDLRAARESASVHPDEVEPALRDSEQS